ncbi:MAG: hypothetical protein Q9227_002944 [Pyrenula ochraceoflavens]
MIAATRRWARRNRNGLAIGFGIVGAAYVAGQYIVGKISEARERMALDRIAKENMKRRFEQNQTDCTFTVLALLPTVTENVLEALPVEQLTQELQQKKAERLARSGVTVSDIGSSGPSSNTDGGDAGSLSSFQSSSYVHASQTADAGGDESLQPRRTKQQLWAEIKVKSITRALTLMYSLAFLELLTRIQLNLLGRLNYLSSVLASSSASPSPPPTRSRDPSSSERIALVDSSNSPSPRPPAGAFETNRRYLTFSWWLLHRGSSQLLSEISTAVSEVFGSIPVTESLTATSLSSLVLQLRARIEGPTNPDRMAKRWLPYLLPQPHDEELVLREAGVLTPASSPDTDTPSASSITPDLRHLLAETADLIDSPHFNHTATLLLNSAFSQLIDRTVIPQAFPSSHASPLTDERLATPTAKLASILAVITRQAHAIGRGGDVANNEYLSKMEEEVKEVDAFAAVIFARNLDREPSLEEQQDHEKEDENTPSARDELRREMGAVEGRLEEVWGRVRGVS